MRTRNKRGRVNVRELSGLGGWRARASLLWAPIALPQGLWLKRRIPRLPEAPGERSGLCPANTDTPEQRPLRLVAIGESPLAGVGLDDQGQNLVPLLAAALALQLDVDVSWQIAARNGATVGTARRQLLPQLSDEPADLALIGLGVNNSLRLDTVDRWQSDMSRLIDDLRARLGPVPVVLAGVPDMGRFPSLPPPLSWMLGARARWLDQGLAVLAGRLDQVVHAPIPLDARFETLFADDGFHPSAIGHQAWSESLLPLAASLIERGILESETT